MPARGRAVCILHPAKGARGTRCGLSPPGRMRQLLERFDFLPPPGWALTRGSAVCIECPRGLGFRGTRCGLSPPGRMQLLLERFDFLPPPGWALMPERGRDACILHPEKGARGTRCGLSPPGRMQLLLERFDFMPPPGWALMRGSAVCVECPRGLGFRGTRCGLIPAGRMRRLLERSGNLRSVVLFGVGWHREVGSP
ncbi:hypothetical protein NDU88_001705 [Pleurodeles waltl]|uniref:Uncharacterized protein n=1 Tax=Pleurodeles waltl TaxID=8319 RepID=A0AAV7UWS2_PLEWA|nr:hypothetical protein NDU88_001705 [Pleurodeles waltl]